MRLPLTEIAAWSGTLVSHRVPPTGFSTTGVSSRGPAPRVNSRRSISWPGRTTDNVCLPCAAFSEHGVEHAMDGLPSRVAVAPAGLLVNITSRGPPGRTGAGRSDWGVGGTGARGLTACLGDGLAGSAVGLTDDTNRSSVPPPAAVEPTGLGLASPGAAAGVTAGAVAGGAAGTGDSSFGAAARCSPLSDGCRPGMSHGAACQPISANNPATARTANRNPRNPDFRLTSVVVVTVGSDRLLRRGGGSAAAAGAATANSGALTSAMVCAFSRPPRGISFHPLLAPQAFSSDWMKSWQLR